MLGSGGEATLERVCAQDGHSEAPTCAGVEPVARDSRAQRSPWMIDGVAFTGGVARTDADRSRAA
jgi:hypothetical protein